MRAVEKSVMGLIANGFNPKFVPDGSSVGDAYLGFVYTSFQERATKVSHGNVGKLAAKHGDAQLARCGFDNRSNEQALVFLSNREIVDASRGCTFHCKMANTRLTTAVFSNCVGLIYLAM